MRTKLIKNQIQIYIDYDDIDIITCVPLIMTVWAGRFIPQARVAVETKT